MTEIVSGRGQVETLATSFDPSTRVLAIATTGRAEVLAKTLARTAPRWQLVRTFSDFPQHVPRATFEATSAAVRAEAIDGVLAFGGGSAIGIAKALATRFELRKVYVPTTFSGSEVTNIWAVSDADGKRTGRDDRVRADLVIYDADLVDSLPRAVAFPSLFNAMAHAVEALYAPDVSDELLHTAQSAARLLGDALQTLSAGEDRGARDQGLRGAYLAGLALDRAQMGLHHKLAHVLGGTLGLSHSAVHTVVLPYVLRYNSSYAAGAIQRLETALSGDPIETIVALQRRTGVPMALRELGMAEGDIPQVVDELFERAYPNPRPMERPALRELLAASWAGEFAAR